MNKYLIVIEETGTGYSAYSPDLPGCLSTGRTRDEVESNTRAAILVVAPTARCHRRLGASEQGPSRVRPLSGKQESEQLADQRD